MINPKLANTFFLIITVLTMSLNTLNTSFKIGLTQNEEIVWECNIGNENSINELFGLGWDENGLFENLSQGKKMMWRINYIGNNETYFNLNISIWIWTSGDQWGLKDKELTLFHYINPNDYPDNLDYTNQLPYVPFWFPIPTNEYFGELRFDFHYDVDNRVLPTINLFLEQGALGSGHPTQAISVIAIYNNQGLLSSYKLYTSDYKILIDISLQEIPFVAIFSTLGLILVFIIGIIIFILRKRKMGD